ncbi:YhcN/YlaJ family sporulation lipoprotein [Virgibacillus necropolis]|uniref:YhcN/YlaJ family sporulation lipoprotein n=1 Tax=Virgibacillus necropolis TaxID=163877 RepID=UPI00384CD0C9
MKLRYGLLFVAIVATGCANDESNEAKNDEQIQSQTINYETKNEQNDRLGLRDQTIGEKGGYEQSEQKQINRGDKQEGDNTDIFTNEQSKAISDHLRKQRDIKLAQVAVTDEKVVVAVMLDEHNNHEISDDIEKEVRKFEPNKTIVVYTDDNHWDRMSNLKARHKQSTFPDDLKDDMKRFFNPDR